MRLVSKIAVGLAGVLLAFSGTSMAAANEWPQWRGSNHDGLSMETGLLKQWPAGGPKLVWKVTDLGAGFSSVSVVKGRIFTMGDVAGVSQMIAIEESTGKKIWSVNLGEAGGGGGYPGTRATPAVSGDLVYALNQFGDLVCAEAASGKEVWRKNLVGDYGGGNPHWGYSESPLVDGDNLFVTPGGGQGAIVALNRKTGALVWQTKEFTDSAHYSSMTIADVLGQRQVIQLTAENVVGIAVTDGKVLWKAKRKGATAVVPSPVYGDNQVFVTSGYGVGCDAFKISKDASGFTTEKLYSTKNMVNHHGGVILLNGYLYGHSDSKGWICQSFKTGDIVWANKGVGKGAIAYADGHFYIRSQDGSGTTALIEENPKSYVEKRRFDQPDRSDKKSWPHPVIVNGKLYLRDQNVLLCYDVAAK